MKVNTNNEWSPLQSVVVGSALGANWPTKGSFRNLEKTTRWTKTPVPSGPVDKKIIEEATLDLDKLHNVLLSYGVEVYRPNFINYQEIDGFYNYCPRDRILIIDDVIVDCNMQYDVREKEIDALDFITKDNKVLKVPRNENIFFDASNVLRLGDCLLYLISESGNLEGANWLRDNFPHYKIETTSVYNGIHIDSTFVPIREGLIALNGDRIQDKVPKVLSNWDKIWLYKEDLPDKEFFNYPYASNYISMNFLMVNPELAIIESGVPKLEENFKKYGVEYNTVSFRHSRTLGGGHHCCTLDLVRGESPT
tara:strand:+ start:3541 stop:4464 length:924 start_codon:yes stop_codon:yes gene_type:complete